MGATLAEVQGSVMHQMQRDWCDKSERDITEICYSGLAEEVGEVLGLRKRVLRNLPKDQEVCTVDHFIEELGDVLWYLAALSTVLGFSLDELWEYNCKKLEERYGK